MKWLKMRTIWAWGATNWEYIPLYVNKINEDIEGDVQATVEEENDRNNYSDKYRRVEYDIINTKQVPNSKIDDVVENHLTSVKWKEEAIVRDRKRFFELEILQGKGRKTDPDEVAREKRRKRNERLLKTRNKK